MKTERTLALMAAALLLQGVGLCQVAEVKQDKDPVAEWVQVLAQRVGHENSVVRSSVEQALIAVGKPALPALEKIAAAKDTTKATCAKTIIERINNPRRGRGRMGPGRGDPLATLKLEGEQKDKAEKAVASYGEKRRNLMQQARSGEIDRSEVRELMGDLREEHLAEMRKILTPEQYKDYEKSSQTPRWGGRRGRGNGQGRGQGRGGSDRGDG